MRRLSLNRSEPARKSGQNIPKNRCRTTIAERMGETRAELPFIGDQVVCLSHDQAARSGPAKGGGPIRSPGRTIAGKHTLPDLVMIPRHIGVVACSAEGAAL